jgi:DivIVA domain-containing protein
VKPTKGSTVPLRPDDVIRKTFSGTLMRRGYAEGEVDAFLEEVVAELRRLHALIDEVQAAAMKGISAESGESGQLAREREQLEMIRAERKQLVEEMARMQAELDRVTAEVAAIRAQG